MIVRVYREIIEQVLGVLKQYQNDDAVGFERVAGSQPTYATSGQELIDLLVKMLTEEPAEKDLIDKIVDTLGLPFVVNRMGSSTIRALRDAVLLPSEIDAFERSLEEHWQCGACHHTFDVGEVTALRRDSNGQAQVRCSNCVDLMYMACDSGKHQVGIPSSIRNKLLKLASDCEACRTEARRASEELADPMAIPSSLRQAAASLGQTPTRVGTAAARLDAAESIRRWQNSMNDTLLTSSQTIASVSGGRDYVAVPIPPPQGYPQGYAATAPAPPTQPEYRRIYSSPIVTHGEMEARRAELQAIERRVQEQAARMATTALDIDPVEDYSEDYFDEGDGDE